MIYGRKMHSMTFIHSLRIVCCGGVSQYNTSLSHFHLPLKHMIFLHSVFFVDNIYRVT